MDLSETVKKDSVHQRVFIMEDDVPIGLKGEWEYIKQLF
jgi:hypothetical protein